MNDSDLLLGVDVGTTGTKAALFNPEGELIALGEAEYGSSTFSVVHCGGDVEFTDGEVEHGY